MQNPQFLTGCVAEFWLVEFQFSKHSESWSQLPGGYIHYMPASISIKKLLVKWHNAPSMNSQP